MKNTFMGHRIDMVLDREYQQSLCEQGHISPKDYWKYLNESYKVMSDEEKERDYNRLMEA